MARNLQFRIQVPLGIGVVFISVSTFSHARARGFGMMQPGSRGGGLDRGFFFCARGHFPLEAAAVFGLLYWGLRGWQFSLDLRHSAHGPDRAGPG